MVEGRIDACKWVKLACQRHLADLARSKDGGWKYYFEDAKANHVCRFIEGLPHTKGSEWVGQSIKLEPWQCFITCSIFGWLKRVNGKRRYNLALIMVPRKNAKSTWAAAVGDYLLCADGEFGAEVYSGATSEKQAWEVFRPALAMVKQTPDLAEAFGITPLASRIIVESTGSRFEPVIAKPGDGASPHGAIVDEYHEHDSDIMVDTFRTGMGARKQPVLLVVSTAGDNLAGPCKAMQEEAERVLEGTLERDDFFSVIYSIDAADDWTALESLKKANPNFGVSVFEDFLVAEQKNAVANARKQNIFKTKHLNIWVGANVGFINLQKWNSLADKSLDPDQFRGLPCCAGVDMASKIDMSARVIAFKKIIAGKAHYYVFGHYYLPEARTEMPELQHYQAWAKQGYLKATAGNMIDYEEFKQDTIADVTRFRIREIGFDERYAGEFAQDMQRRSNVTMVEVPQRTQYLSGPMKQMEALITDGRLHHDGNPVLTWMMGNIVAHTDRNENVFPEKPRPEAKIDGAVALIMALGRLESAKDESISYTGLWSVKA